MILTMDEHAPPDETHEEQDLPKILIAEDVDAVRIKLEYVVRALGFEPLSVTDGRRALMQFVIAQPPIVLLDIGMPSMSGLEVCRRIRETSEDARIVMITGDSRAEVVQEAIAAGADDFISKPFTIERLSGSIERILSMEKVSQREP